MRALTYDQAVEVGLEPRDYAYESVSGEFEAVLDFKVWGDLPPEVVPPIVLVHVPLLAQEVVPKGSTLPRGAGWRPVLADVVPASGAA